ncbi:MAG: hypothetical protein K6G88_08920 [Lachnospiraceae bacterium]|nr:hypothetical protein [Lachnospiraceae bacterium]
MELIDWSLGNILWQEIFFEGRNINGKSIYYIKGVANPKKGVVGIVKDGKIQTMMNSDYKSFTKMQ